MRGVALGAVALSLTGLALGCGSATGETDASSTADEIGTPTSRTAELAPTDGDGCPQGALPLGENPVSAAADVALTQESTKDEPQVTGATIAPDDSDRGPQARRQCGSEVWRRTVVVYITLRRYQHPPEISASLSERVDFVSRFKDGYRVWQLVH